MSSQVLAQLVGKGAEKYTELSSGAKFGVAVASTATNPVFWIATVIIVLIISLILWIAQPCWLRTKRSLVPGAYSNCNGYEPAGYLWTLFITSLIVIPLLFIIWTFVAYGIQSTGIPIVAKAFGSGTNTDLSSIAKSLL